MAGKTLARLSEFLLHGPVNRTGLHAVFLFLTELTNNFLNELNVPDVQNSCRRSGFLCD